MAQPLTDAHIQSTIDGILSKPPYYNALSDQASSLLERLGAWLERLFQGVTEITGLPTGVVVAFIVAVALLLGLLVVRHLRNRSAENGAKDWALDEQDPGAATEEYAAQGDFKRALFWLFQSHLKTLEAKGLLMVDKSKTNAQYARELTANSYGGIQEFRTFGSLFNAVRYGDHPIDGTTYERWRLYAASFQPERSAA